MNPKEKTYGSKVMKSQVRLRHLSLMSFSGGEPIVILRVLVEMEGFQEFYFLLRRGESKGECDLVGIIDDSSSARSQVLHD